MARASCFATALSDGALTFVRTTPSDLGNFETGTEVLTTTTATPEPGSALLMLLGLSIVGALALRSRARTYVVSAKHDRA